MGSSLLCLGFSLVGVSGGYSLVAMSRLLIMGASLCGGLSFRGPLFPGPSLSGGLSFRGLLSLQSKCSRCTIVAVHRLSSCDVWA